MPQIHATAIVSDQAKLADDVVVGPFAIIDGPVVIGPGTEIAGHVLIQGLVEMGAGNKIGHGATIGTDPQDVSFDPSTVTGVKLGDGNTIRENVSINRATTPDGWTSMGDGNFLMIGSHLAHDVVLGNENVLANNVMIAGHVEIGNNTFVGGGAGFHQFLRIGDYAFVQGNSSISKDVPPYCFAFGANQLSGLNIVGLRRAGFAPAERTEIKSAYALLFQSGFSTSEALEKSAERDWPPAAQKLIDAVKEPTKRGVLTRSLAS